MSFYKWLSTQENLIHDAGFHTLKSQPSTMMII